MKTLLLLLFTFLGFRASCQINIVQPQLYYVSARQLENTDWLKVGEKVLFRQECSPELPPDVPNGTVVFENVYHEKERFSMAVQFRDTIVDCITYYLNGNQQEVLGAIGLAKISVQQSVKKDEWTYSDITQKVLTTIVGDNRKITVIKKRIP